MKTIELKPCPFCGGEAEIQGEDYFWSECKYCSAETMGNWDVAEAIEAWNRRVDNE